MGIRDCLRAIFAFSTLPTTVLLILTYAAVFSSVLITDNLPPVPKDTRGLDLDRAWWDLHRVSHPLFMTMCGDDLTSQDFCETSSL